MNKNYKECFERGDKYEDFVYPIFCEEWGVKLIPYKTKIGQRTGENSFGVEIKFDEKSITSKNLSLFSALRTNSFSNAFNSLSYTKLYFEIISFIFFNFVFLHF